MNPDIEEMSYKGFHSRVHHQYRTISWIENGEIEHSADKIGMLAEFSCPFSELDRPFLAIFFEIVAPVKKKLELVVAVIGIPENAH